MVEHEALREAAAASRLSTFRVGIGAVGGQSEELFAASVDLAVGGGHGVHIHLQEIREEVTATMARFGRTPIAHCADAGPVRRADARRALRVGGPPRPARCSPSTAWASRTTRSRT